MGAKNKVIAGDLNEYKVSSPAIIINPYNPKFNVKITKTNVTSYEVLDEKSSKSAVSAVGRGLLGSLIVGPVGLLAGLSAKSKGIHIVAIEFKDGKRSLLEVDDKIYKAILKELF